MIPSKVAWKVGEKVRVHELASVLGKDSKETLNVLNYWRNGVLYFKAHIVLRSASSGISLPEALQFLSWLDKTRYDSYYQS